MITVSFSHPGIFNDGDEFLVLCPVAGEVVTCSIALATNSDTYPKVYRLQKESGIVYADFIEVIIPVQAQITGPPAFGIEGFALVASDVAGGSFSVEKNTKLTVRAIASGTPSSPAAYVNGYFQVKEK
jgi:hypothetical protein